MKFTRSIMFPATAAIVLLVVVTVVQGIWTDRWGQTKTQKLDNFTARLAGVPDRVGPWVGEEAPVDPEQIERAGVTGYVSRLFRHEESGQMVNMLLVAGTSRHVTLHTPDWCYRAAGFESEHDQHAHELALPGDGPPAELATNIFSKETPTGRQHLRIFWTFSVDGTWHGPAGRGSHLRASPPCSRST